MTVNIADKLIYFFLISLLDAAGLLLRRSPMHNRPLCPAGRSFPERGTREALGCCSRSLHIRRFRTKQNQKARVSGPNMDLDQDEVFGASSRDGDLSGASFRFRHAEEDNAANPLIGSIHRGRLPR